jgi:hypothetical protein
VPAACCAAPVSGTSLAPPRVPRTHAARSPCRLCFCPREDADVAWSGGAARLFGPAERRSSTALLGPGRGGMAGSSHCLSSWPASKAWGDGCSAEDRFWLSFLARQRRTLECWLVAALAPGVSGAPSCSARAPQSGAAGRSRVGAPTWGGTSQHGEHAGLRALRLAFALVFARAHIGLFLVRDHRFAGLLSALPPPPPRTRHQGGEG